MLPEKAKAPISGILMMITMVLMMPGLGLYVQKDMLPPNTDLMTMWVDNVVAIAPYAVPIALVLGVVFNILVGLFIKKPTAL